MAPSQAAFESVPPEARRSVFRVTASDGATLPVYELAGAAAGPALLFGHANGFAGGSYLPFLRPLAERARVFTFDARGHGGATWPEGDAADVFAPHRFAEDLAAIGAVVADIAGGAPHYAAHSLNAVAALRLAATGQGPDWPSLTLFEPAVFPAPDVPEYGEAREKHGHLIRRTAARRSSWDSREAFAAYLRVRGVFAKFAADALDAHARATTRCDAAGDTVGLCSPPAVEAAIFRLHMEDALWRLLPRIRRRLRLVSGDPADAERDWVTAVMRPMAARLPAAELIELDGVGHMLPFEAPEACRELVLRALE
jgi:pimeloyl-ACP methyl ester carboxylesterase